MVWQSNYFTFLQAQVTQVYAITNQDGSTILSPQILEGDITAFVGGEIDGVADQQWATQHVTIIHQNANDVNPASDLQTDKSIPTISWDVGNPDVAATGVPLFVAAAQQNDTSEEVNLS